jgi:hypothetical protein
VTQRLVQGIGFLVRAPHLGSRPEGTGYAIRLPTNSVCQGKIGHLFKRPVGRPPQEVRRLFASFSYRAQSRNNPPYVAKVEWHPGNAVRLQLHALAYNFGNFMRTLAVPRTAEPWSLTSLREKLINIGAKAVSRGRYVTFQMAEVAVAETDVPGNPVADRAVAGTARAGMTRRSEQMRRTTTAEVRPDAGRATRFSVSARVDWCLDRLRACGTPPVRGGSRN